MRNNNLTLRTSQNNVPTTSISFSLSKRQKIIIAAILITIGLISTQMVSPLILRTRFILSLGALAYILSLWALWEGMTKLKAITLLILPTMFTMAVPSFYFLLPVRWLTRLPVAIIFGLCFYSLLLSQNVFNVAAIRTIPLYRAASTVSFVFTIFTSVLLYNVVFSLNLPFFYNGILVTIISFPLFLQLFWSVEMNRVTLTILTYSILLALVMGEFAIALSFWPVSKTIWSIYLATTMYVLLGVVIEHLRERLNRRIVIEYAIVGVSIFMIAFFIIVFLQTSWTT